MPKEIPIKLFLDTVPIPSADNVSESVTKMFFAKDFRKYVQSHLGCPPE